MALSDGQTAVGRQQGGDGTAVPRSEAVTGRGRLPCHTPWSCTWCSLHDNEMQRSTPPVTHSLCYCPPPGGRRRAEEGWGTTGRAGLVKERRAKGGDGK